MSQLIENAKALRKLIEKAVTELPDDEAAEYTSLHPVWQEGQTLKAGSRVQYNGKLYTVLQTHSPLAKWQPDQATSLFSEVISNLTSQESGSEKTGSTLTDVIEDLGSLVSGILPGKNN